MPSPFSGIIADMRARQLQGAARQQREMDFMARLLEQQEMAKQRQADAEERQRLNAQLRLDVMNQSPYLKLRQQKAADQAAQDKAWLNAFLQTPLKDVPPEMRGQVANYQYYLSHNPEGAGPVAKALMMRLKPQGARLVATQTIDADGNPITSYEVFYPATRSIGPVSGFGGASSSSPTGAAVGARPSAAAPTSAPALGGAAGHFYERHFAPDDSGGP